MPNQAQLLTTLSTVNDSSVIFHPWGCLSMCKHFESSINGTQSGFQFTCLDGASGVAVIDTHIYIYIYVHVMATNRHTMAMREHARTRWLP